MEPAVTGTQMEDRLLHRVAMLRPCRVSGEAREYEGAAESSDILLGDLVQDARVGELIH